MLVQRFSSWAFETYLVNIMPDVFHHNISSPYPDLCRGEWRCLQLVSASLANALAALVFDGQRLSDSITADEWYCTFVTELQDKTWENSLNRLALTSRVTRHVFDRIPPPLRNAPLFSDLVASRCFYPLSVYFVPASRSILPALGWHHDRSFLGFTPCPLSRVT